MLFPSTRVREAFLRCQEAATKYPRLMCTNEQHLCIIAVFQLRMQDSPRDPGFNHHRKPATRPSVSTESNRHLPSVLASPVAAPAPATRAQGPNLNIQKASGVSQSVAPVILPSLRPRGLRPLKTARHKSNPLGLSRHHDLGAHSGIQAQSARHARHL